MSTILPFLLIVVSLTVIITIIVRKFPQLSLLDLETVPDLEEKKKKQEIVKKRVEKKTKKKRDFLAKKMAPLVQKMKDAQLTFRKYVGKVEKTFIKEKQKETTPQTEQEKKQKTQDIRSIIQSADKALKDGDLVTAEKSYLEAIKLDAKSVEAYRGLADVYCGQDQVGEAKETLEFVLHLDKGDDQSMIKLGDIYAKDGKYDKAVEYYQQAIMVNGIFASRFFKMGEMMLKLDQMEGALEAFEQSVELEAQNPKYLDKLLEISIMGGTKKRAQEVYDKLRLVNAENKKLDKYKTEIEKMEA